MRSFQTTLFKLVQWKMLTKKLQLNSLNKIKEEKIVQAVSYLRIYLCNYCNTSLIHKFVMHSTHQIPICKSSTNRKKKTYANLSPFSVYANCFSFSIYPFCFHLFFLSTVLYACAIFIALKVRKNVFSHNPFFCYIACWSGRGINNLIKTRKIIQEIFGFIVICIWDWQMHGFEYKEKLKIHYPDLECGNISGSFFGIIRNAKCFFIILKYW